MRPVDMLAAQSVLFLSRNHCFSVITATLLHIFLPEYCCNYIKYSYFMQLNTLNVVMTQGADSKNLPFCISDWLVCTSRLISEANTENSWKVLAMIY